MEELDNNAEIIAAAAKTEAETAARKQEPGAGAASLPASSNHAKCKNQLEACVGELRACMIELEELKSQAAARLSAETSRSAKLADQLSAVLSSRWWRLRNKLRKLLGIDGRQATTAGAISSNKARKLLGIGGQQATTAGALPSDRTKELLDSEQIRATEMVPRAVQAAHGGAPDRRTRVGLATIFFNNTEHQVAKLCKSISIAAKAVASDGDIAWFVIANDGKADLIQTIPRLVEGVKVYPIDSVGNIGFAGGMNLLFQQAFDSYKCDVVVALNPDMAVHHDALAQLIAHNESYGPALVEARQFPEELAKDYDPLTGETRWCSGACLLVPREIYASIGGFDPAFFMYVEDVDFSWRARNAGFKAMVCPHALAAHQIYGRTYGDDAICNALLGARLLGHKWGNERYRAWAEYELLARGLFADRQDMPAMHERIRLVNWQVPYFRPFLNFAPVRWSNGE